MRSRLIRAIADRDAPVIRHAFLRMHSIGCTPQERAVLLGISDYDIEAILIRVSRMLAVRPHIRTIDAICLGRSAPTANLPCRLRAVFETGFGRGTWIRQWRLMAARASDEVPATRVVVHECVHACIDLLSHGFPYPTAVTEGYACVFETLLCGPRTEALRSGYSTEGITLASIFNLHPRSYFPDRPIEYARMVHYSHWANSFVHSLGGEIPSFRRFLGEVRRNRLMGGDAILAWMCAQANTTYDVLEARFQEFLGQSVK